MPYKDFISSIIIIMSGVRCGFYYSMADELDTCKCHSFDQFCWHFQPTLADKVLRASGFWMFAFRQGNR